MISDVVGDWDTVSFLTTVSGRGVAQGSVNIQPISSRSAEIVQHELGHSHGFMGDEYDSRGERSFPSWYAEFSVNTTAVSDPSIVKWKHFIEDIPRTYSYINKTIEKYSELDDIKSLLNDLEINKKL